MIRILESLNETTTRCAREILAAMRRERKRYLRFREVIDGQKVTMGVKDDDATIDEAPDLPSELRVSRLSLRQVYRALRALREERGPHETVFAEALVERLDRDHAPTEHSLDTARHMLADLRDLGLAWRHAERGWLLGREQQPLPFAEEPPEPNVYLDRLAALGVNRPRSRRIWVPGERTAYGVAVPDGDGGWAITPEGDLIGEMLVPTRSGRLTSTPAARGELVSIAGMFVVVRFADGRTARVRVLGEWQLRGLTEPDTGEAEASA